MFIRASVSPLVLLAQYGAMTSSTIGHAFLKHNKIYNYNIYVTNLTDDTTSAIMEYPRVL